MTDHANLVGQSVTSWRATSSYQMLKLGFEEGREASILPLLVTEVSGFGFEKLEAIDEKR